MVCKCSLVERLDLLPIAVLLMIGGKLPAQRAKSAHFVGHLPVNPNMKLVLLQQLFWWVSSSRDLCSPEYLLDFRHNTVGIYRQVNLAESHSDNAGLRVGAPRASRLALESGR